MMMNIDIREATTDDLTEMAGLFVETIRAVNSPDYTAEEIAEWTKTADNKERGRTAIEDQYFIVAMYQSNIVGMASLRIDNYLDFMYVHKDYQRQGIAQRLYSTLELKAKEQEIGKVFSDVSITAKPFFEKQGFHTVKMNHNYRNGQDLINYRMEKEFSTT